MKRLLLLFFSLGLLSFASSAEPADLGSSLSYLRVRSLGDAASALPSALAANHACVLDLRYATASDEATGTLRTALIQHPASSPLFILISPATPLAVVDTINHTPGSFLTLSFLTSRSAMHIAVKTDAETDRRAYDAFEAGTPVETLISGKIEKERFDEASLVEEFKNGNLDAAPPTPALPGDRPGQTPAGQQAGTAQDSTAANPSGTADKPAVLIDRVLQRAVQLHQALLALHR